MISIIFQQIVKIITPSTVVNIVIEDRRLLKNYYQKRFTQKYITFRILFTFNGMLLIICFTKNLYF